MDCQVVAMIAVHIHQEEFAEIVFAPIQDVVLKVGAAYEAMQPCIASIRSTI